MKKGKDISRRNFLKKLGAGATTITVAAATSACGGSGKDKIASAASAKREIPTDKMTYRVNHNNNDRVSLLGYGCMRWPMVPNPSGHGEIVDQESVNRLIDFALEHGVNYFDTSPEPPNSPILLLPHGAERAP